MKIGYPCINHSLECKGDKTFRLKSYSEERLRETVENNLKCLSKILQYNLDHQIFFFRISSDLIPFASHPICKYPWQDEFKSNFKEIGSFIKKHKIRISMHPDQFIIINAKDNVIVKRSVKELIYHSQVLDLLKLDYTAKIQLHIGGVYGEKNESLKRFINNYERLNKEIKNRLVIENDHQRYNLKDCLYLSNKISIPILFDYFHHQIYNCNEKLNKAISDYVSTWEKKDGIPLCDYSSQRPGYTKGSHAHKIDKKNFRQFLELTKPYDMDIMLEIKDKEKSAIKAINIAKNDGRFLR